MSSLEYDTLPPPPPAPAGRRLASTEIGGWVAALAITVVAAVAAALAGVALGVFGLAGVALAGVVLLFGLAVGPWRRAGLALAVIGASLAATAALTTLQTPRIERSAGLLAVAPVRAADADGQHWRRGLGSVVIDLRQARFTPGEQVRFSARSDAGRVVVALPAEQCVDVRLTVTPLNEFTTGASLVRSAASSLGVHAPDERYLNASSFPSNPFDVNLFDGGTEPWLDELGPVGGGVTLFGRDLLRSWVVGATAPVRASRMTGVRGAPVLDLALAAPGAVVVRDLPDDIGPMARGDLAGTQQVSDASWPRTIELPASPEAQGWRGRWRKDWSKSPRELQRWRVWEQETAVALWRQAQRLAGPCASRADRQNQWVTARYGVRQGNAGHDTTTRLLAVNALGELVVRGLPGHRLANRSAEGIIAGTRLRALTAPAAAQRRGQFLAAIQVTA